MIDARLVKKLVADQFPQWASLAVEPIHPQGIDNMTFRLGDEMKVRLPSAEAYSKQPGKEFRWMCELAPFLPLPIPAPLALGKPGLGYHWPWSICPWIEGEYLSPECGIDLEAAATALAAFISSLHRIDAAEGPRPGAHNFFRGGPPTTYDVETRTAIDSLNSSNERSKALAIWEGALAASWDGKSVWIHGDLSPSNLLTEDGQLAAVIDFGNLGVGDPACDLTIAWTLFSGKSRDLFMRHVEVAEDAWIRARGWALWKYLITGVDPGLIDDLI